MIKVDYVEQIVKVSEDTSLDELAKFLNSMDTTLFKVVIYGTDENTDTSG